MVIFKGHLLILLSLLSGQGEVIIYVIVVNILVLWHGRPLFLICSNLMSLQSDMLFTITKYKKGSLCGHVLSNMIYSCSDVFSNSLTVKRVQNDFFHLLYSTKKILQSEIFYRT